MKLLEAKSLRSPALKEATRGEFKVIGFSVNRVEGLGFTWTPKNLLFRVPYYESSI